MQPKIYTSQDHHIRNDLIDPNALSVLQRLHEAGHTAYLVGGGVRDLLMRKKPKDFDISTSARPEQVKAIFRNCLLIGRRFRLAHIRFGRQIIEVATFRAGDPTDEELIVRDNIWGDPEEDVMRRDFTLNGLFYNPQDHKIIDYVGGFEDLQKHYLRVIGDPQLRFKQDPVRMIRMQKFRARFGFNVDPEADAALIACRQEIIKSSPARVLEEILRMLESGAAEPFFKILLESDFLSILFPSLAPFFQDEIGASIFAHLKAADDMNTKGRYRTLDRSILTAAIVFPILESKIQNQYLNHNEVPHLGDIFNLSHSLIQDILFEAFSHFPRKIRMETQFVLQMQYRLIPFNTNKKPRIRMAGQKGFTQALTFLKLRALLDHKLFKTYEYWKRISSNSKRET
ncbi:MAG: Poly(A) polymerase I [Chlamydiales bacterium]|nr:Poly(A) polymerase I [Chlamydiales bacterium]